MRVVTRALLMASTVSGRDWAEAGAINIAAIAGSRPITNAGIRLKRRRFTAGREGTACRAPTEETSRAPAAQRRYRGQNPDIKQPPRMAIGATGARVRSRREFLPASLRARRASDGVPWK